MLTELGYASRMLDTRLIMPFKPRVGGGLEVGIGIGVDFSIAVFKYLCL